MFWKLIVQAAKSINENRGVLAKALLIPFLINCALRVTVFFLPDHWFSYIAEGLTYGVQTIIAITTHRVVLLGSDAVSEWGLLKWTKRETAFTLYVLGLLAIWGTVFTLNNVFFGEKATLISVIFLFVLLSLTLSFSVRISLVFPSIAIGQSIGPKGSWKLTEGYDGLMMQIGFIFPLLVGIPFIMSIVLFVFLIHNFLPDLAMIEPFSEILEPLFTVFTIVALSVTYRYIMDEKGKKEEPTPETQPIR